MSQECFEFVVYIIYACAKKRNMTPFLTGIIPFFHQYLHFE